MFTNFPEILPKMWIPPIHYGNCILGNTEAFRKTQTRTPKSMFNHTIDS